MKIIILLLALVATASAAEPRTSFGPKEVLTTAREIIIKPTREMGEETYAAGSPVRVLKTLPNGKFVILIGETNEQAVISSQAIVEAGGTTGDQIKVSSTQPPKELANKNTDGPEGTFSGIATGDENIASSDHEYELEILRLTNLEREKAGVEKLVWDEDLARAARYQAADLYVQSYSPEDHATYDFVFRNGQRMGSMKIDDGQSRIERFASYGKAENVRSPKRTDTPIKSIEGWMGSPGHRSNILTERFTKMGVGYITGEGGSRLVQVFGI